MNWYTTHTTKDTLRVNLHGDLGHSGQAVEPLVAEIEQATRVELICRCMGGCSSAGKKLYSALKSKSVTATIHRAGSALWWPLLAAARIRMSTAGKVLVHAPCFFIIGTAQQLRNRADQLDRLTTELSGLFHDRRGIPRRVTASWMAGKDFYFDGAEALRAGLCDELFTPPDLPTPEATGTPGEAAGLAEDWKEGAFWAFCGALGRISTKDAAAFEKNLKFWYWKNIKELPGTVPEHGSAQPLVAQQ